MQTSNLPAIRALRPAWNKGRIVGQKRPLKPKHVWAIRVRLELAENHRDLALFNLAIDSKLRGCDLVRMKVVDVMASGQIKERTSVLQSKTQKPVRFEISEGTRASVAKWMEDPMMIGSEYLWPGRFHERLHIPTTHLRLCATALIVSAAHLPGHSAAGAYCGNVLVTKSWIDRSLGAENRCLRRRDDDLDINSKQLHKQAAGGVTVIGPIGHKAAHVCVNLIQKLG